MVQWVMLIAFAASLLRAALNIIDRRLFGYVKAPVLALGFVNNVLPLFFLSIACLIWGMGAELLVAIDDLNTLIFALLVQLVSYFFSLAFRYASVHKIIVYSKLPDIFIPIGVFLLTGRWAWVDYGFGVLTTLVCLPIFFQGGQRNDRLQWAAVGMVLSLVLQGSLSAVLIQHEQQLLKQSICFTTAVIFWRASWSIPGIFYKGGNIGRCFKFFFKPLVLLRSLVAISTQVSFVLALSFEAAVLAWPILNATSLFAVLLSSVCLKEKARRLELTVVLAIVVLAMLRFGVIYA